MASPVTNNSAVVTEHVAVRYAPALTLLASLFFMWGFITVINNTTMAAVLSVCTTVLPD